MRTSSRPGEPQVGVPGGPTSVSTRPVGVDGTATSGPSGPLFPGGVL